MELEKQIVSLELAKKLKELGVKQESLFAWVWDDFSPGKVKNWRDPKEPSFLASAFTVAELGEIMKQTGLYSGYSEEDVGWYCQSSIHNKFDITGEDTEADARAKMLIYLLENKLLEQLTLLLRPTPKTT